jgi:hypothetical protein
MKRVMSQCAQGHTRPLASQHWLTLDILALNDLHVSPDTCQAYTGQKCSQTNLTAGSHSCLTQQATQIALKTAGIYERNLELFEAKR